MANARLQDLESIMNNFINRGIGSSGLARQAVERAQLPSLRQTLAKSRADASIFRAQEAAKVPKQPSRLRSLVRPQAGFDPSGPQAVVVSTDRPLAGKKFGITVNTGTGQKQTFRFENLGELRKKIQELQKQGTQVVLPGTQKGLSAGDVQGLQQLGVFQRSDAATVKSFLGQSRRRGAFENLKNIQAAIGKSPSTAIDQRTVTADQLRQAREQEGLGGRSRIVLEKLAAILRKQAGVRT